MSGETCWFCQPWFNVLSITVSLFLSLLPLLFFHHSIYFPAINDPRVKKSANLPLRFKYDGTFKILQVADMHFGNGLNTRCRDVALSEAASCSDLNTTMFLRRMIQIENPDLVVFTGDNIFGSSATDAAESLFKAFAPVMESKIPWAAILGNHDQESTMSREELMRFISLMDYSVSQISPSQDGPIKIDGFGNYNLKVSGAFGSDLVNISVLNLYFLDSGDHEMVNGFRTYGWIRESQQSWLCKTSHGLQATFKAPALTFFHIPVPEVRDLWFKEFRGAYQESVACSKVNSGALKTIAGVGDVKAVFIGHDHLNDFCGEIEGVWFCYGGGFGYHGYGRPNWPRRGRIIQSHLKSGRNGWAEVDLITTWKRLDDEILTKFDDQVLWKSLR